MLDPATDYARRVVAGQEPACRLVRLQCQRHLSDLERDDVWFDTQAVRNFAEFCGFLNHYKGTHNGAFELAPWQWFLAGGMFGWKRVVNGVPTDEWKHNNVYCEVPRKNGKTTFSAGAALWYSLGIHGTGAEVYVAATNEDQAKLLFNDALAFVRGSKELGNHFEILTGRNILYTMGSGRTSFLRPLTGKGSTKDGLNPLAVICDELHAWKGRELWDTLGSSFGSRGNMWQMLAITTAGFDRNEICWEVRQHGVDILNGRFGNDRHFTLIYSVDEGEEDDWRNPDVWRKANPGLGTAKSVDTMRGYCQKAQEVPSFLNEFLNKQLNIWTDSKEAWLSMDDWKGCEGTQPQTKGLECWVGMDLARTNDLSAVAVWFPAQSGLTLPWLEVECFAPEGGVKRREDRDKAPYRQWARDGLLTLTPGDVTDYEFILARILKRCEQHRVRAVCYDRHFAGELVQALTARNVVTMPVGMGFLAMSAPTAEFERLVVGRKMRHERNALLDWCVSNTAIVRDPAGNKRPDKSDERRRIDAVVASIIALSGAQTSPPAPVNPYATRGLLTL